MPLGTTEREILEPVLDPVAERDRRRGRVRVAGEVVLTLGVVMLLFALYETVLTDWTSAVAQEGASAELDRRWQEPPQPPGSRPSPGDPELRLWIPALGDGWSRTVLEGVGQDVLAAGPGHYPGTAMPGDLGNVAIAGHRVGHGAPFDAAADVRSCDAVVVETRAQWFVYRVLPLAEERAAWAKKAPVRPECRGFGPLDGLYGDVVGREIVGPTATEVIAPVPDHPGLRPTRQLLTITTCHPRFSARQRMVLHAALVTAYAKADHPTGWRPLELAGA